MEVDISGMGVAGFGSINLKESPQLRESVVLIKVEAFNTALTTKGPSGKTNAPDAFYKTGFLTISDASQQERAQKIPLASIIRTVGVEVEDLNLVAVNNTNPIDPQNSKLEFGDLSTKGAGEVVILLFTYLIK